VSSDFSEGAFPRTRQSASLAFSALNLCQSVFICGENYGDAV
jgi:hypothetical protein